MKTNIRSNGKISHMLRRTVGLPKQSNSYQSLTCLCLKIVLCNLLPRMCDFVSRDPADRAKGPLKTVTQQNEKFGKTCLSSCYGYYHEGNVEFHENWCSLLYFPIQRFSIGGELVKCCVPKLTKSLWRTKLTTRCPIRGSRGNKTHRFFRC